MEFIDSKEKKRSRIMYIAEATLEYLICIAVGGAYLATLGHELGMSDSLIGIISSIISLGCLFQLLSVFYRRPKKKKFVIIMSILNQLLFTALYILPIGDKFKEYKSVIFIVVILAAYLIYNIAHPKKIEWMMSHVDDKKRGKFTANKEITSLIVGMVFTYGLGAVIDHYKAKEELKTALIIVAFVMLVVTALHTLSMIFTTEEPVEYVEKTSLKKNMQELLQNKKLMGVVVVFSLYYVATHVATPFYGAYLTGELQFSMILISTLSIASSAIRVFFGKRWGAYADKTSFANMLTKTLAIQTLAFVFATLANPSNGVIMMAGYYLCYGIAIGGINSCYINLVFDYVTPEKRADSLAICLAIAGLSGFLATLAVTPLFAYIQANELVIAGMQIYAQQVVSFIAFILTIVAMLFVSKKMLVKKEANE